MKVHIKSVHLIIISLWKLTFWEAKIYHFLFPWWFLFLNFFKTTFWLIPFNFQTYVKSSFKPSIIVKIHYSMSQRGQSKTISFWRTFDSYSRYCYWYTLWPWGSKTCLPWNSPYINWITSNHGNTVLIFHKNFLLF